MDILFVDAKIEKLCADPKLMQKQLGANCAKKLRARLADLRAAESFADIRTGRPHPLRGNLAGCMALDLEGGKRLVFEAADDPPPLDGEGNLSWRNVTTVRIVFVGDYHD